MNIIQKTKESLKKIEDKRRERKVLKFLLLFKKGLKEYLQKEEIKDCTFSPNISKSKYEISPDRRRIKEIANLEFKKKGIWQKKWNINNDSPSKPRISIVIII